MLNLWAFGYVTPSMHERFGLTPLEPMASGAPVIAACLTSLPEVVDETELLVDADVCSLAGAKITRLIIDDHHHAGLRHRGLARARMFSRKRTADVTIGAYKDILAGS